MSISTVLGRQLTQLQRLGVSDQYLQQLGREGFLVGSLSQLDGPQDLLRIAPGDRRMLEGIASALIHGGPGIPQDIYPRSHYVETVRPVRLETIDDYARARFRRFDPQNPKVGNLTIVRGESPRFIPPPDIEISSQAPLDILQMLEYAGVHYAHPESQAASAGAATFLAGRNYVLDRIKKLGGTGVSGDWIGFDWDFTADVYRIYAELGPLISMKLFGAPPADADKKFIRVLEAAKPGMHELMVGMMAGYAIKQGLLLFSQWEHYHPQVRVVTQTWPERLMVLGNEHMRLLPLMMGRFPGLPFGIGEVASSKAFLTLNNFLSEADRLLDKFWESHFRFEALDPAERDDLMAIMRTGKGHTIKSMGAFEAVGWVPPSLIFDDGPVTNSRMIQAGVQVVQISNPIAPGKEMSDLKVVTLQGRRAAFHQTLAMLSRSETSAILGRLTDLLQGEPRVDLAVSDSSPTPEGTIVVLHDTKRSLDKFFLEFEEPKRRLKKKIRQVLKEAGGLRALEKNYREAVSKDPS